MVKVFELIRGFVKPKMSSHRSFTSADFLATSNAALLAWFIDNPGKKLHWEWELFGYYVYWGAFLNILVFTIVSAYLTREGTFFSGILALG